MEWVMLRAMQTLRHKGSLGWLAWLLLVPIASHAQERPIPRDILPGIGPQDPRRPVDARVMPFQALARVQHGLGGRCTGALIAPNQVLTAAHCLIARRTENLVQPGSVHVLLGYERGAQAAQAQVVSFRTGPGYRPGPGAPADSDWAILTLARDIAPRAATLPLLNALPAPRTPLTLAGYQQDRPEVLLADTACRVLGVTSAGMLLHDCAGTRGVSGAPLLIAAPGGWAVAGVASRAAVETATGLAVPAATIAASR
ncbi:trypsin-like serine protease [Roseococcus sp. SDR]|uniref:trypsin-like serine peptidase n=1 Tax=Roseococcus sp. SDR TaxID=2835532 RepID=UPI001BCCC814|nr:trypsin-like serine protease [Roseococcus sp. SDR]MBS7790889.1 trypsin-like serine protease [Roseococcus sp. SDR]MBV1846203.1 trypsin-like serine protease [Roseococcus sp. SDR]